MTQKHPIRKMKEAIAAKAAKSLIENLPDGSGSPMKGRHLPDSEQRRLDEGDFTVFDQAATERPQKTAIPKNLAEQFIEHLELKDYFRYRRVLKELRWVRKQADKFGLSEGEIPWGMMH